jgi:hypothetical protein
MDKGRVKIQIPTREHSKTDAGKEKNQKTQEVTTVKRNRERGQRNKERKKGKFAN